MANSGEFLYTYDGDILSLNYIKPTIEAKSLWIPGKTCAFDVEVAGETAYYYENETFDVSEGAAGRKLDLSLTGAKRHSFDMDRSYGIGGIVPMVGKDTISEDIVGRKLLDSAKGVIVLDNQKGLAAMLATSGTTYTRATVTTAPTAANIYGLIVDDAVEFKKNNKAVIDGNGKAKGGWEPEIILVGPRAYGLLQKSEEFVKYNADFSVNEAVVGKVAGLEVVYSPDLRDDNTSAGDIATDWVIMNPNGFLAPKGVSATEVFGQVEGRPGAVLAQAEMVYGFHVLDKNQILAHERVHA